jgi:hypothetical protein
MTPDLSLDQHVLPYLLAVCDSFAVVDIASKASQLSL